MAAEMHAVRLMSRTTAHVLCEEGDFHEDAQDTTEVPVVMGHAAMHAMALGHVVHEHVTRDVTVSPEP